MLTDPERLVKHGSRFENGFSHSQAAILLECSGVSLAAP